MSRLEDLVPPLELCKKIPQGKFADSALVWMWDLDGDPGLFPRECGICNQYGTEIAIAPAPTLAEILEALGAATSYHLGDAWLVALCNDSRDNGVKDANPATAALRLWLKVFGKETEND